MEHLYTSKKMSRVFRGLVLALAVVLVACGGESDDAEPTATAGDGQEQEALPTVPPVESTPDTTVNEEDITVLSPEIPATADASTPDVADEVTEESTPVETEEVAEAEVVEEDPQLSVESTPADSDVSAATATVATDVDEGTATPGADETVATENVATVQAASDATPAAGIDADQDATADVAESETDTESTEPAETGNETYNNPGDGTGGSGMPGERESNEEESEGTASATPEASPVAQLEISGCEVPDVPGFLGESNIFELTADVNFRSGPGVECDPLLDEPIGEGQIVLVLGGPVTQTDDSTEWVLIEVDGEPGWITTEFLEPTE